MQHTHRSTWFLILKKGVNREKREEEKGHRHGSGGGTMILAPLCHLKIDWILKAEPLTSCSPTLMHSVPAAPLKEHRTKKFLVS